MFIYCLSICFIYLFFFFIVFFVFFLFFIFFFFFSSRRRHTRYIGDWSSDVCSSDLPVRARLPGALPGRAPSPVPGSAPGSRARTGSAPACRADRPGRGRSRPRSEERRVGKECRTRWGAEW